MMLLLKIAWRALTRMLWFGFAGAIAMPLVCGFYSLSAACVFWILSFAYKFFTGTPYDEAVMAPLLVTAILLPVFIVAPVSFVAFGIAGLISSKKTLPDRVLSEN